MEDRPVKHWLLSLLFLVAFLPVARAGSPGTLISGNNGGVQVPVAVDSAGVLQVASGGSSGSSKVFLATNDYSSTNVTTSAYVQLVASTSGAVNHVYIFDSSGSTLVLAVGGSGSEVDQFYIFPGGISSGVPLHINAGSRISIKAVDTNATTGRIAIFGLN